jgi:hypothetical protein
MSILEDRGNWVYCSEPAAEWVKDMPKGVFTLAKRLQWILERDAAGVGAIRIVYKTHGGLTEVIDYGDVELLDFTDAKDTDSPDTTDDLDLSDVDLIDYWFRGFSTEASYYDYGAQWARAHYYVRAAGGPYLVKGFTEPIKNICLRGGLQTP